MFKTRCEHSSYVFYFVLFLSFSYQYSVSLFFFCISIATLQSFSFNLPSPLSSTMIPDALVIQRHNRSVFIAFFAFIAYHAPPGLILRFLQLAGCASGAHATSYPTLASSSAWALAPPPAATFPIASAPGAPMYPGAWSANYRRYQERLWAWARMRGHYHPSG